MYCATENQGLQDGDANDRHEYLCELKEATLAFAREHFPVAGRIVICLNIR